MDDEQKEIQRGRRDLAKDALDHAKRCIGESLYDSALNAIAIAERQIEKWVVE